ncbi:LVIVD repeat-containing protein [Nocardia mexicana]|uniref:LVIVD repeat-containing protein n=2 Tax=Nocardia mexicana TaxID=279262 RepID=A0A370GLU8_9NOCA|nr:LVIVD repeat-containing protein [Nocardia mexicana]
MALIRLHRRPAIALAAIATAALMAGSVTAQPQISAVEHVFDIADAAVTQAPCGTDSMPESGLQGDVSAADRASGRSARGYSCNITKIGGYAGRGGGITSATFEHCVYIGSFFPGNLLGPAQGVQVLDVSDPANPILTDTLTAPAMLAGTWESLKVNITRKLLIGAGVPALTGSGLLAVYDLTDCAHPRLLNPGPGTDSAQPLPITAHEGGFSPDGNTYWSSGVVGGLVSAVDLADPTRPRVVWQGTPGKAMHGLGVSEDGNRLYLADNDGGLTILDSSAVQRREPNPQAPILSRLTWSDGWATQHNIPVTYKGRRYLFTVDEAGSGGVKVIDIADDTNPAIVNTIKLAINVPENQDSGLASSMGGSVFGYDAHYCTADRPADPTALACGWVSSGIRVFDVRDPMNVREVAYYNPPARTGRNSELWNSPHALASIIGLPILQAPAVIQALDADVFDPAQALGPRSGMIGLGDLSSDWCLSAPNWHGNQLWATCADNTFMTLQLDPAVYTPPADQLSTSGS